MATKKRNIRRRSDTKEVIFRVALDLFSEKGYSKVGVRDIANVLGIKSASLYNHYDGKDSILESIFQRFYDITEKNNIETRELIEIVPTTPPGELIERLVLPVGGEAEYDTMCKILVIAMAEHNSNSEAAAIVSEVLFATTEKISLTLYRMQELGLIKPVDVNLFTSIYLSISVPTFLLFGKQYYLPYERWKERRKMLLGLICEDE